MNQRIGVALDPSETGSLRAVFLLALGALSHTHYVSEPMLGHLADAVFEAYIDSCCPPLPLSPLQTEDLAVLSIDLLTLSVPDLLIIKH